MSALKKWQHLKIEFGEIERATNNFETCIGKGGYGWVYKGQLNISGKLTMVAVKRFYEQFGQGLKEFLTELDLLFGQQHPNLITLLGFCDDLKEKIIVYEFAERGSLDNYIRPTTSNTRTLSWLERLKISVDAASGLDYLHHHVGQHQTIIHRDVKSANILLDENWVAKISDLGLSKLSLSGLDRSVVISHACGTPGYCEPEYVISGTVTKKSDVYSFGMVLFEVLCGKLCTIKERDGFLLSAKVAKQSYKKKKLVEIVDPSLREHLDSESMTKFSAIAYKCLHKDREQRPSMDVVKKELEKTLNIYEQMLLVRKSPGGSWKNVISTMLNSFGKKAQPSSMFDGSRTSSTDKNDHLFWFQDIGEYGGGEYSLAVVQANQVLEDQGQIESGPFGTFVGVYDGHCGPQASQYVCDHLFRNFQETSAKDNGVVTQETIKDAFLQTENGFTDLVSRSFMTQPSIATAGSCCLVGVIYQQTLFIANLGDSRVVLGKKVGNSGDLEAIQLSSEHNVNLEEIRDELRNLHPHDPEIVVMVHGLWRIKGIIQLSRSIGDVYMKHPEYNAAPLPPKFRLPESTVMPILSATPSIHSHDIHPSDAFLIFASDGLWEQLTNQEAVSIVHNNPRLGIAKRLAKAALETAAKKREMKYSDLRKIDEGLRRHFHDDITVVVLFLNYDQISRGSANGPIVSIRSASRQ